MVNEKVTSKEINNAMNNFMKNAAMPAGMVSPIMSMMGNQAIMPAPMPIQNPYGQITAQQAVSMGGMQGFGQPQVSNMKGVGLAARVRYGKAKVRNYGTCKDCRKCTLEGGSDPKLQYLWCNAKAIRVQPDEGINYIENDVNGKKEKAIDGSTSCRIFEK